MAMNDRDVLGEIDKLVAEEHALLDESEAKGALDPAKRERLDALQVHLDQCWDLLRQRRARREFGEDPNAAKPRDPKVVERYVQ